jgi:hypothetical protein
LKNADFGHQMALFENLSETMQFFAPRRRFFRKMLSGKEPILTLLSKKV